MNEILKPYRKTTSFCTSFLPTPCL